MDLLIKQEFYSKVQIIIKHSVLYGSVRRRLQLKIITQIVLLQWSKLHYSYKVKFQVELFSVVLKM